MHQRRLAAIFLALAAGTALGQDTPRSRLVVVGDADTLLVGQEGYCGSMNRVSGEDLGKIVVEGGKPTWVRYLVGGNATGKCTLNFSFMPQPGQAYIARYTANINRCQVELFRVRPGQDPVRESLRREPDRSCLIQ